MNIQPISFSDQKTIYNKQNIAFGYSSNSIKQTDVNKLLRSLNYTKKPERQAKSKEVFGILAIIKTLYKNNPFINVHTYLEGTNIKVMFLPPNIKNFEKPIKAEEIIECSQSIEMPARYLLAEAIRKEKDAYNFTV